MAVGYSSESVFPLFPREFRILPMGALAYHQQIPLLNFFSHIYFLATAILLVIHFTFA